MIGLAGLAGGEWSASPTRGLVVAAGRGGAVGRWRSATVTGWSEAAERVTVKVAVDVPCCLP